MSSHDFTMRSASTVTVEKTQTQDTRIQIPAATRDLLVRLGWTPPKEAADVLD